MSVSEQLQAVVALVKTRPMLLRYAQPEISVPSAHYFLLDAAAGPDRIALIMPGLKGADGPKAMSSFVRSVIQTDGLTRLLIEAEFPVQALDLQEATGELAAAHQRVFDDYDENVTSEESKAKLAHALDNVVVPTTPELTAAHQFVRWSRWEGGTWKPAGVVGARPDQRAYALAFPGHESKAGKIQSDFTEIESPEHFLNEDLPEALGRMGSVSAPETVKGASFEDAADRALYRFAADVFKKTGQTLYPQ